MDTYKRRWGINKVDASKVTCAAFGGAFNLDKQAILYLSENVPEPTRDELSKAAYLDALTTEITDLVSANQGNAFVLFTARDELEYVNRQGNWTVPVITQGESASQALNHFRATPGSVLLGLKSFWEGVDVQGDKLSLVIIAKLPFPGKSDPVTAARRKAAGDSWFAHIDLPDMIMDLRQGIGRLIRSTTDRGVIAILDRRMLTKPYRARVLGSLGFKGATKNKDAVVKALNNLSQQRSRGCV
jgi:Rad3-related DNA helicase